MLFRSLTEVLAQWTVVRKARDAQVAAARSNVEPTAAGGGEELEIGGLAAGEAMRTFGFSRELFTDLAGKFHHQYVGLPVELETALAANDGDKLMRLAHTVRGSAGYLGAADIKNHAAAVEDSLREGKGVDFVAPLVAELRSALKVVLDSTARFDTAA